MLNFLRYGDKVMIQSSFTHKDTENWGVLSAEGFYDEKVYFEKIGGDDSTKLSKNFRDNVFVICPVLNYEFHKEYTTSMGFYEKIEKIKNNSLNSNGINKSKIENVLADLKQKMVKLQEKMNLEVDINRKLIKASKGKYIRYNDGLQLLHYKSKFFLTSRNICSNTSAIGYQAEVSRNFCEGMIMKIIPRFNSFQNGDYIQAGDEVKIQSSENEFYLTINAHESFTDYNLFNVIAADANDAKPANNFNFLNKDPKHGIYFNNTSKNGWKIYVFQPYEANKIDNIGWLDLVRFIHFEHSTFLTISDNTHTGEKALILEPNHDSESCKAYTTHLWQLEAIQISEDKILTFKASHIRNFSLRNIYANRLLGLGSDNKVVFNENTDNGAANKYILNFERYSNEKNSSVIEKNNVLNIMNLFEGRIAISFKNNNSYSICCKDTKENICYLQSVSSNMQSQSQDQITKKVINGVEFTPAKEDSFIVQRIAKNEQYWIFNALSLLKYFKLFINMRNFENFLRKVDSHLVEIVMFIFDDNNILNYQFPDMAIYNNYTPNTTKQTILQEFQIFELLVKVLDKLNLDSIILNKKKTIHNDKTQQNNQLIIRLNSCKNRIYYSLIYLIKNNPRNQLYLSKWSDEFIKRVFESTELGIDDTFNYEHLLKNIFMNNPEAIKNKLNVDLIQTKLCEIVDHQARFLKFIQVMFFLCNAFASNKREMTLVLSELLFDKNSGFVRYLEFDDLSGNYFIRDFDDNPVELKRYDKTCEDMLKYSKYFEVVNIIAESKDKAIIQKLQDNYRKQHDMFINALSISNIYDELKIQLVKLVFNIWIKRTPSFKVKELFCIKSITTIEKLNRNSFVDSSLIKSTSDYSKVVKLIFSMLTPKYFRNYTDVTVNGRQISQFQNTILTIGVWLFEYGLLKDISEVKYIISFAVEFSFNEELHSNQMMILLNKVFDFNHNYSLTLFVKSLNDSQFGFSALDEGVLVHVDKKFNIKGTGNVVIHDFLKKLAKAVYSNNLTFLSLLSTNLLINIFNYIMEVVDTNSMSRHKTTDQILTFLEHVFYYRKHAFKRFTEIFFVPAKYQNKYDFALKTYFSLKQSMSSDLNSNNVANIMENLDSIAKMCFASETDYELYKFINNQNNGDSYTDYNNREVFLNIDLVFNTKPFDIVMQTILLKANIVDVLFKLLSIDTVGSSANVLLYDKILATIAIICFRNPKAAASISKKHTKRISLLFDRPRTSYLFFLSVLLRNNAKALKHTALISDFFDELDKRDIDISVSETRATDSYFIFQIISNLVLYYNKIIIYNQSAVASHLVQLFSRQTQLFLFLKEIPNQPLEQSTVTIKFKDSCYEIVRPSVAAICTLMNLLCILTKGNNTQKTSSLRNLVGLK